MRILQAHLFEHICGEQLRRSQNDQLMFPASNEITFAVEKEHVTVSRQQMLHIPGNYKTVVVKGDNPRGLLVELDKLPAHLTHRGTKPINVSREIQKYSAFLSCQLGKPLSPELETQIYEVFQILLHRA